MSGGARGDRARPLVIAVGNRFRSDDAVAAVVLDVLAADATVTGQVDLVELDGEATRLVDAWEQRERVVVLDAVVDPQRSPGELVVLIGAEVSDPDCVARRGSVVSGHSAGLAEALRLAAVMERLPVELSVVGVVAGSFEHGTELSPPVAAAVPAARAAVVELLGLSQVGREGGSDRVPV